MAGLFAAGRIAAEAAETVPRMPEQHGARERQQRALLPFEPTGQLAQIGEPHPRLGNPGRGERRRAQRVERRLDRRDVESEMRALVDDPEKHEFAAPQPLIDIVEPAEYRQQSLDGDRGGARLAFGDFDDQVLGAPDRDEDARRIEHALADPAGVAAAQTGAFEAGMGVIIGGSHPRHTGTASATAASRTTAIERPAGDLTASPKGPRHT